MSNEPVDKILALNQSVFEKSLSYFEQTSKKYIEKVSKNVMVSKVVNQIKSGISDLKEKTLKKPSSSAKKYNFTTNQLPDLHFDFNPKIKFSSKDLCYQDIVDDLKSTANMNSSFNIESQEMEIKDLENISVDSEHSVESLSTDSEIQLKNLEKKKEKAVKMCGIGGDLEKATKFENNIMKERCDYIEYTRKSSKSSRSSTLIEKVKYIFFLD